jgi:hypothetical protein
MRRILRWLRPPPYAAAAGFVAAITGGALVLMWTMAEVNPSVLRPLVVVLVVALAVVAAAIVHRAIVRPGKVPRPTDGPRA